MLALGVSLVSQSAVGGFDADAAAGIAAVLAAGGSLTGAQQTACNTAVVAMKAAGVWTKLYRWWPIVGGTANSHIIDWKTATSQATNVNSPTHSASGAKSNGTTSYMSTSILPGALGATGSLGVTLVEPRTSGNTVLVGSSNGADIFRLYPYSDGLCYNYFGKNTYTSGSGTAAGNHAVVRLGSTSLKAMFDGEVTSTNTSATTVGVSAVPFFLLAHNLIGVPVNFTNYFCSNFWMGTTMVQSDITALSAIIDALETAFGR